MNIPRAILRGVEISFPRAAIEPNIHMMTGVSTITKNGLMHCQISGATESVATKSRANTESDCPFWWNENQKNTATPSTAKRAYMRCFISLASACTSVALTLLSAAFTFFAGLGSFFITYTKTASEMSIATTDAMNEKCTPVLKISRYCVVNAESTAPVCPTS